MADKSTASASASISFPIFAAASLVLLVLKLGDVAGFGDISWWWVAAPMLFGFGLTLLILTIAIAIGLIVVLVSDRRDRKNREARRQAMLNRRR